VGEVLSPGSAQGRACVRAAAAILSKVNPSARCVADRGARSARFGVHDPQHLARLDPLQTGQRQTNAQSDYSNSTRPQLTELVAAEGRNPLGIIRDALAAYLNTHRTS
jgi:hypothetical protein